MVQYGAVWCSALQCDAVCCSMLQSGAVCCSMLQCVAVCCSALQCDATCDIVTNWRGCIRCLKLKVNFRKRATNYRALLRKLTCKDKAPYGSLLPCSNHGFLRFVASADQYMCVRVCVYVCMYAYVVGNHMHANSKHIYTHTHTHTHTIKSV